MSCETSGKSVRPSRWVAALSVTLAAGCGGDAVRSPGSGGSGEGGSGAAGATGAAGGMGSSGGAGATARAGAGGEGRGGGDRSGDCDDNQDCPGSECIEITPGGFKVCKVIHPEATECNEPGLDECCTTADCAAGACLVAPLVPICGGPQPIEHNVCALPQCTSDADCLGMGSFCAPAGTLGNKVDACSPSSCTLDVHCNAEPGGICAPVDDPCCGGPIGLFCVYPDGCRSSGDCGPGEYCAIQPPGQTACMVGMPVCPG